MLNEDTFSPHHIDFVEEQVLRRPDVYVLKNDSFILSTEAFYLFVIFWFLVTLLSLAFVVGLLHPVDFIEDVTLSQDSVHAGVLE